MKYVAIVLCFLAIPSIALSQNTVQTGEFQLQVKPTVEVNTSGDQVLEITTSLLTSEEGREALDEFHARKSAGTLQSQKSSGAVHSVGARVNFKVRNINTNAFEDRDFTLKHDDTNFRIWVETDELNNGHVRDEDVESLRVALADETPAPSYNSSQGIIDNDIEIFGATPNVDGDGKTDILLVDVRDGYNPPSNSLFVAGFFDPTDLSGNNNADIVYLDTMPGMVDGNGNRRDIENLLQTTAHEFQHLIHANYDGNEHIWVNEAQSEWAEIELGYPGRTITYLSDASEHNVEMFAFRSGTFDELLDRERGAIVSKFFAEQVGVLVQGSVTQETANEEDGYIDAFGSETAFTDVVLDYHTAVHFNDTSFNPRFGFSDSRFTDLSTPIDLVFDGRTVSSVSRNDSLVSGGARYVRFDFVEDFNFEFTVDGVPVFIEQIRDRHPARLVFEDEGGSLTFDDIRGDGTLHEYPGVFESVTVIFGHSKPGASGEAFSYEASWMGGSESTLEDVAYDNGTTSGDYFTVGQGANNLMATGFAVPAGNTVTLDKVRLTNTYENMFSGGNASDPRDFTLKVWAIEDGKPTSEIYSQEMDDPRAYAGVTSNNYNFFEIDLSGSAAQLDNLPDSIAVGIGEAGLDANYMVMAPFAYASSANISWLWLGSSWADLWDLTLQDGEGNETSMDGHALPVQVTFLIQSGPVSIDDDVTIPGQITLDQNYPNPFNPTTNISFTLSSAQDVDLGVFDLLGRRVTTLTSGLTPAGSYDVPFDGTSLASGMYLYRLTSDEATITRTMMLLK